MEIVPFPRAEPDDGLNPARGIVHGVMLGLFVWIPAVIFAWMLSR